MKSPKRSLNPVASRLFLTALAVTPAAQAASNEALEQRIRELESRLQRFEQTAPAASVPASPELEKLKTKVNTLQRKFEVEQEVSAANASKLPKLEGGKDGFRISSQDGKHNVRFRAQVQTDARFYADDHGGARGAFNYQTGTGIPDQFQVKQARVWVEGKLWNSVYFKLMPDFAASNVLADAYVDYAYLPYASLSVGKQKTPLSLERVQGDADGMFLERAYPTALASNRDVGVMLHGEFAKPGYKTEYGGPIDFKNFVSYQLGVFNGSGDNGNSSSGSFDDKEFTGRVWVHPFQHSGYNHLEGLGLGIAGSWSRPTSLALSAVNSAIGQNKVLDYSQFRTGATALAAEGEHTRVYPQAYWYSGPFGVMGEYALSTHDLLGTANGKASHISQNNSAWQTQVSYVLTGEDNSFQGVKPIKAFNPLEGTWGALQLAGRWSELSVDKDTFLFVDPAKGIRHASSWAVGLNWYLNSNALIRADYEQTDFTGGAGKTLAVTDRPTERVFGTRFQLNF
jgi:phosphate-selective porin OprO/OprP